MHSSDAFQSPEPLTALGNLPTLVGGGAGRGGGVMAERRASAGQSTQTEKTSLFMLEKKPFLWKGFHNPETVGVHYTLLSRPEWHQIEDP